MISVNFYYVSYKHCYEFFKRIFAKIKTVLNLEYLRTTIRKRMINVKRNF